MNQRHTWPQKALSDASFEASRIVELSRPVPRYSPPYMPGSGGVVARDGRAGSVATSCQASISPRSVLLMDRTGWVGSWEGIDLMAGRIEKDGLADVGTKRCVCLLVFAGSACKWTGIMRVMLLCVQRVVCVSRLPLLPPSPKSRRNTACLRSLFWVLLPVRLSTTFAFHRANCARTAPSRTTAPEQKLFCTPPPMHFPPQGPSVTSPTLSSFAGRVRVARTTTSPPTCPTPRFFLLPSPLSISHSASLYSPLTLSLSLLLVILLDLLSLPLSQPYC